MQFTASPAPGFSLLIHSLIYGQVPWKNKKEGATKELESDWRLLWFLLYISFCVFVMLHCCFRTLGYTDTRPHKYEWNMWTEGMKESTASSHLYFITGLCAADDDWRPTGCGQVAYWIQRLECVLCLDGVFTPRFCMAGGSVESKGLKCNAFEMKWKGAGEWNITCCLLKPGVWGALVGALYSAVYICLCDIV